MDKTFKVVLSCAIALMLVGAPTAEAAKKEKPKSVALQVVEAAGVKGMKDVSQERLAKAMKDDPNLSSYMAVNAGLLATGLRSSSLGLGSMSEAGGSLLLSLLLSGKTKGDFPMFVAWVPTSEVNNAGEAQELVRNAFIGAFNAALAGDVTTRLEHVNPDFLLVKAPGCEALERGGCTAYVAVSQGIQENVTAPAGVGGFQSFAILLKKNMASNFSSYPFADRNYQKQYTVDMPQVERLELLGKISENLPPWVYIYLPPRRDLLAYPVVLNQGRTLLFIEPGPEEGGMDAQASIR